MWMSFDPQEDSGCPFGILSNQPVIYVTNLTKNLYGQLSHFRILADETRLNCVQAWLSIFQILRDELLQLAWIFYKQGIKEPNSCEILVNSFNDHMG